MITRLLSISMIVLGISITSHTLAEIRPQQPAHNGLGSPLPAGFSIQQVLSLVASDLPQDRLSLIGVVAWPRHPNFYLAFLCEPETVHPFEKGKLNTMQASCFGNNDDNGYVYLALLAKKPDGAVTLVAKGLFQRYRPDNVILQDYAYWFDWRRFDLAPYTLNDQEEAFGIRVAWGIPYAGGGASTEALYLFRVEGKTIKRIFASFIGSQEDIAGNWREDGTREHFQTDSVKILQVLSSKTSGFHDLIIKDKDPQVTTKQIYRWSADKQYYLPAIQ